MVFVCVLLFLAVLGDGNEGSVEVPSVANAAKEERVTGAVIGGEFGGVELGLCKFKTKIIVFGGFRAPAATQVSYNYLAIRTLRTYSQSWPILWRF